MLLSRIFLKEHLSWKQYTFITVVFIGIILTSRHKGFSVGRFAIAFNTILYGISGFLYGLEIMVYSIMYNIIEEKPDVVSFSSYIWNITKTLEICKKIKKIHNCKIVLGGPEVAYRPKDILEKYDFIDFVLSGEGEWSFPDFLDNINEDLSKVAGLSYRKNGEIISSLGIIKTD